MSKPLTLVKQPPTELLPTLKLRLPSMTPVLKTVGKFVLENPDQVIYQSINEVAEASGVSVASVVRLCKELDFVSFAKFKLALASEFAASANADGADRESAVDTSPATALSEQLAEVIRTTAQLVDMDEIDAVAKRIVAARRVLLYGVGASFIPASFLSFKLTRLGIANEITTDAHMMAMAINLGEPKDLLFLFSSTGSVQDSNELAALARQSRLATVAITNRHKSPLGEACDRQLVAMGAESPLSSGSLEAKCGQLFIVELLFEAICRLSKKHRDRIHSAADAVSDRQL